MPNNTKRKSIRNNGKFSRDKTEEKKTIRQGRSSKQHDVKTFSTNMNCAINDTIRSGHGGGNSLKEEEHDDTADDNDIRVMIKSLCNHAFERDLLRRDQTVLFQYDDNSNGNGNSISEKGPKLQQHDQDGSTHHNKKVDDDQNIALRYTLKQNVGDNVNTYLKSLQQTETKMASKFETAKCQILDHIKILKSHYDELCRKEVLYVIELNQCRQSIIEEAEEFCTTQIERIQHGENETNTK